DLHDDLAVAFALVVVRGPAERQRDALAVLRPQHRPRTSEREQQHEHHAQGDDPALAPRAAARSPGAIVCWHRMTHTGSLSVGATTVPGASPRERSISRACCRITTAAA